MPGDSQIVSLPVLEGVRTRSPKTWANRSKGTSSLQKNDWKGKEELPLWKKHHPTVRRWEPEKHNNWGIPIEGFWNHVATGGSLFGVSGKWGTCGWSVVQLGHDEEMERMHGMHRTLDAELDVQRTIKRAELTSFYRSHDGAR